MIRISAVILAVLVLALAAHGLQDPPPDRPMTTLQKLRAELIRLSDENDDLRQELAAERLRANEATRELAELRQFILDHDELGRDFEQYREVRKAAEMATRLQTAEVRRQQRARQDAERRNRMQEARARREADRAETDRINYYRRRGFAPLGLDVFLSKMAYQYQLADATGTRVDYHRGLGHYLRLYPGSRVDFSAATISGSVLNASEEVRNIGVAIAFFDELGNQVGHEMVQITNARPDVPYPFTSTVAMALDRPFASSSQYVLYSDVVAGAGQAPGTAP